MVTRPEILATRRDAATAELQLRIPEDLVYFKGHFAGLALLPGVVQVDWAVKLAREFFGLPPFFKAISALKFQKVITPGMRPLLQLSFDAAAGQLSFAYSTDGQACSSGRVLFAA